MDFTTCHIEGLEVGIAEIKGMKVTTAQAIGFLNLLQLNIL